MPRVWNKRDPLTPPDAVYVGRPTMFGNPFTHLASRVPATLRVDTREEAIARYEVWLAHHPELIAAAKRDLRGKDLVCWCAPQACHADTLLRIANEEPS